MKSMIAREIFVYRGDDGEISDEVERLLIFTVSVFRNVNTIKELSIILVSNLHCLID